MKLELLWDTIPQAEGQRTMWINWESTWYEHGSHRHMLHSSDVETSHIRPLTWLTVLPGHVKAAVSHTLHAQRHLYSDICFHTRFFADIFSHTALKPSDTCRATKLTSWKLNLARLLLLIPCLPPPPLSTSYFFHKPSTPTPFLLSLFPPPFILWALSLTAGSDYGCEKWGSHASNPPPPAFLQHDSALSPCAGAGPVSASLPLHRSASLSFFSCLYFFPFLSFFFPFKHRIPKEEDNVCLQLFVWSVRQQWRF